ncbi:MAG TPA: hypothetical protein PK523_12505, partial [Elusimicrobiales bacterium]|nr:hypothetical protein [Elusimicrobiales bacterium]
SLVLAFFACPAGYAPAADYSRMPLLTAPLSVRDEADAEVILAAPVSRHYEMAQLDVVFSTGVKVTGTLKNGGFNAGLGVTTMVIALVTADGREYVTENVIGRFYPNGVLPKFRTLPPRKMPLRKMTIRGRNIPPITQIYWVEGREKRSEENDDPSRCSRGVCNWNEAADYCSSEEGRLLTVAELKDLYAGTCRGKDLYECKADYWSAAEYAHFPRKAWLVDFTSGEERTALKTAKAYVRCVVRRPPSIPRTAEGVDEPAN